MAHIFATNAWLKSKLSYDVLIKTKAYNYDVGFILPNNFNEWENNGSGKDYYYIILINKFNTKYILYFKSMPIRLSI